MKNFLMLLGMLFSICTFSYAADTGSGSSGPGNDIASKVICNIAGALSGSIAQSIATLVIIITGYSFFVGKVSIGMLFIITGGIALIFGSQSIMGWVMGKSAFECSKGEIGEGTGSRT